MSRRVTLENKTIRFSYISVMKNTGLFLLIVIILFSCREEKKSRLDFEMSGIEEKPSTELGIKEYPDLINITQDSVTFSYYFDTNYSNYDSNLFNNAIIINAKIENLSNFPLHFITHGGDISSNIIGIDKYFVSNSLFDVIVCFPPRILCTLEPKESISFSVNHDRKSTKKSLYLRFKMELLPKNDEIILDDNIKSYKTLILYSHPQEVPRHIFKK